MVFQVSLFPPAVNKLHGDVEGPDDISYLLAACPFPPSPLSFPLFVLPFMDQALRVNSEQEPTGPRFGGAHMFIQEGTPPMCPQARLRSSVDGTVLCSV